MNSLVMYNAWKTPEEQNRHCTGNPDKKRKPGRPRITWMDKYWRYRMYGYDIGKTFVLRQPTEKSGSNGLPGVLVTGRTNV